MASSFEKSVKGATKIKAAPPKTKYIEHILIATHSGEVGVAQVFRALQYRLRDSTWTVVFKSLITVHLMIREGSPDITLAYLGKHRNLLAVSVLSDANTQGRNIRHYSNYLAERARSFRETKIDWVRSAETRLEKLTVDKGLLRETESVQHQLTALLKCDVLDNEPENEITITVFRLLVLDLLALFQALNQAMINILGHFFFMAKSDAERAMDIYRNFTKQTDFVVQYLGVARQYEHHTRVEVPKLKHAPVNLGRQLEEYLRDTDFEVHRRQYLAEQEAKKTKGGSTGAKTMGTSSSAANRSAFSTNGAQTTAKSTGVSQKPEPNLMDFFESIEQNQTPMALQPRMQAGQGAPSHMGMPPYNAACFPDQPVGLYQPNGFAPQPTGFPQSFSHANLLPQQTTGGTFSPQQQSPPQQSLPSSMVGAGFGSFSTQPPSSFQPSSLGTISQNSVASFQNGTPTGFSSMSSTPQQTTNPFRTSMFSPPIGSVQPNASPFASQQQQQQPTGIAFSSSVLHQPTGIQSTNPFAQPSFTSPAAQSVASPAANSPFQSSSQQQQQQQQQQATPFMPMATGTNPFQRNYMPSLMQQQQQRPVTAGGPLMPQATGTNPFRQGLFGGGASAHGDNRASIGGGLDTLQSVSLFPQTQASQWHS